MFTGRSTLDVVTLIFTITVCLVLLLTGAACAAVVILNVDFDGDLKPSIAFLQDASELVIGALLGLLAGSSRREDGRHA